MSCVIFLVWSPPCPNPFNQLLGHGGGVLAHFYKKNHTACDFYIYFIFFRWYLSSSHLPLIWNSSSFLSHNFPPWKSSRSLLLILQEMASEEMKKVRDDITKQAIKDHQLAVTGGTGTDQFKCGKCGKRNTTYNQVRTAPLTSLVIFCCYYVSRFWFNCQRVVPRCLIHICLHIWQHLYGYTTNSVKFELG